MNANEIIIYQADELTKVEVQIENGMAWLNRQQISKLFDRDIKTIGKHINNAIKEELIGLPTVANFATVQKEGNRTVKREIEFYNLDVIISVGYRVKSRQGIKFRIWANKILKEYLLKGYSINNRLNKLENNLHSLSQKVEDIDFQINTNLPPNQGIFYDGQVFDAYVFVSQIIKSAKKSIILVDNYIDESVLQLFTKRDKGVACKIYTKTKTASLTQDLKKHNTQYPKIDIIHFTKAHDRFIIIDEKTIYHIGASLKDLGKKWFAFSKMQLNAKDILKKLQNGVEL